MDWWEVSLKEGSYRLNNHVIRLFQKSKPKDFRGCLEWEPWDLVHLLRPEMLGEGFRLEDGTEWIGGIAASSSNELEEVYV